MNRVHGGRETTSQRRVFPNAGSPRYTQRRRRPEVFPLDSEPGWSGTFRAGLIPRPGLTLPGPGAFLLGSWAWDDRTGPIIRPEIGPARQRTKRPGEKWEESGWETEGGS